MTKGEDVFAKQQQFVERAESVVPRLKELTGQLMRDPDTKVYKTIEGRDVIARILLGRDEVGVMDVGFPEGDSFNWHIHQPADVVEIMSVYQGEMEVLFDDGTIKRAGVRDHVEIAPGRAHAVRSIPGTGNLRMIVQTIPKEASWPNE